jgi:hypothetical protein
VDSPKAGDPRFEFQTRLLERGAEALLHEVGRLDDILFKVKASAVAAWVALMGWAFTTKNVAMIPLGFVVIIGFWLLEGLFRGIQIGHIDRGTALTQFFNDCEQLNQAFGDREFPANIVFPVLLKQNETTKLWMYCRGLVSPTVATLYLFLALSNFLIVIAAPLGQ